MKRLIIALVLFVLILLTCIVENKYIEKVFSKTKNTVQTLEQKCLNGEALNDDLFENLNNNWDNSAKTLALFISRKKISDLTDKISLLKTAYKLNKQEFIILSKQITDTIEEIEMLERINTYGIL